MKAYGRELAVTAAALIALILLLSGALKPLEGGVFYFVTFRGYVRGLFLTLCFLWLFTSVARLRPYREIFLFIMAFLLGFLGAELLYRSFHPKLSLLYPGSPFPIALLHMDYFTLHRLYQVIPLACMALLFFTYPPGYFASYLKAGDWSRETDLVGAHMATWKKITAYFVAVLFYALAGFAVIAFLFPPPLPVLKAPFYGMTGLAPLFISLVLFSLIGAFMEESFFRGIFLPVFTRSLGADGIIFQAFLFGAIHFDISQPLGSIGKLVLFTFLGWIWGKATVETGGIGAGLVMHGAIIFAIQCKLYFIT
ncbi:MAG: CPBP family intramembrane glutamic endopeptidase [Candidatus Eremiobacteraeota bacterium]|nr:CPBP family intramembrane glutamic endopeptidase [Candidatus Eremiobacteraeota bacterium]